VLSLALDQSVYADRVKGDELSRSAEGRGRVSGSLARRRVTWPCVSLDRRRDGHALINPLWNLSNCFPPDTTGRQRGTLRFRPLRACPRVRVTSEFIIARVMYLSRCNLSTYDGCRHCSLTRDVT